MGLEEKAEGAGRQKSSFQLRAAVESNVMPFIERLTVEGKEHLAEIPKDKHVIIATTHMSDLDIPLAIKTVGQDLDLAISNASTQHSLRRNFQETLGILAAGKRNFLPIDFAETGENNVPLPFNPDNYAPMAEALDSGKAVLVAAHNPSEGELGRGGYAAVYLAQLSGAVVVPVAVSIPGPAIMMRKKETKRKADARIIIGKPLELPRIENISDFRRLLDKRTSGEEITDADSNRFRELTNALRGQSETLMRTLAQMLPEDKRGPYGQAGESESTTDTSG